MKKQNKNIFLILYFFIKYKFIESRVIFPINTLNVENYSIKNNENNISHSNIIKSYFFNILYATFEIGSPSQKVSLIINSQKQDYKIFNYNSYNNTNDKLSYNYFNESKSSTYKTEGCKETTISEEDEIICKSNDTFSFYNDINIQSKFKCNNFYFQLIKNIDSNNIPGEVGLGPFDKYLDEANNFFKVLKNYNLINTYYFYIDFNLWNDSNGKLIIGDLPHIVNPNKYSEEDLMLANIYIESSDSRNWKFEFDKIYINQTFLFFKNVELVFDSELIIGTNELDTELNYYFFSQLKKNENFFDDIFIPNEKLYANYRYYYFDINIKETLYKLIPSIILLSNKLNYTFEITKDELFIIKGNYMYLKILFPTTKQQDYFIIGRILTLKYPFVFNPDLKQIGIYTKLINKKENFEEEPNNRKIIYIIIIIIIISSILLVIIGIIFGKYLYGTRKKRAYELNEDYEYNQSENEKKDNNVKIGLLKENNDEDTINN